MEGGKGAPGAVGKVVQIDGWHGSICSDSRGTGCLVTAGSAGGLYHAWCDSSKHTWYIVNSTADPSGCDLPVLLIDFDLRDAALSIS